MTKCPKCGYIIQNNQRGQGWQGAYKITKLGWIRAAIIDILQLKKAHDFSSGLTSRQIGSQVRDRQQITGKLMSTDHSVGGRVSELQGLKLIESEINEVELYDKNEQAYRNKKFTRYYLTELGKRAPIDENWNPQTLNTTMTQLPNLRR